jgi:hypothetical protein
MAGSGNQQNYQLSITQIVVSNATLVSVGPYAGQQGLAFQWISGATLCYYGWSALAAGGTFGFVMPSASGGAPTVVNFPNYRGPIKFLGAGATSAPSIINMMVQSSTQS